MPTESAAVRALKAALAQATTPSEKADVASKLAHAQHQQGIERGRRRRARAAKVKAAPTAPPVDDGNDEWDSRPLNDLGKPYDPIPVVVAPQAPAAIELDEDESAAVELERQFQLAIDPTSGKADGWSRVCSAANSPGAMYWDATRGWVEDIDPRSSIGAPYWSPWLAEEGVMDVESYQYNMSTGELTTAAERQERERRAEVEHNQRMLEPTFTPWSDEAVARVLGGDRGSQPD